MAQETYQFGYMSMFIIIKAQPSMIDLAIEHENCVVAHGQAFNTGDDQIIHTRPIGSDNVRVNRGSIGYGCSSTHFT